LSFPYTKIGDFYFFRKWTWEINYWSNQPHWTHGKAATYNHCELISFVFRCFKLSCHLNIAKGKNKAMLKKLIRQKGWKNFLWYDLHLKTCFPRNVFAHLEACVSMHWIADLIFQELLALSQPPFALSSCLDKLATFSNFSHNIWIMNPWCFETIIIEKVMNNWVKEKCRKMEKLLMLFLAAFVLLLVVQNSSAKLTYSKTQTRALQVSNFFRYFQFVVKTFSCNSRKFWNTKESIWWSMVFGWEHSLQFNQILLFTSYFQRWTMSSG